MKTLTRIGLVTLAIVAVVLCPINGLFVADWFGDDEDEE